MRKKLTKSRLKRGYNNILAICGALLILSWFAAIWSPVFKWEFFFTGLLFVLVSLATKQAKDDL